LHRTLKGLVLKTPTGSTAAVTGSDKRFEFAANDRKLGALTLQGDGKENPFTIVAKFGDTEEKIPCGNGTWIKSHAAWGGFPAGPLAASGAWTGKDTFTAKICFYETPFVQTVKLQFVGDQVKVDVESNVGFGPSKQAQLVGKTK